MALKINGIEITSVKVNGTLMNEVKVNGESIWSNTCTLTWKANGGSPTTQNTTGGYGKLASDYLPTIPTKTGYSFSSWSPNPSSTTISGDLTFTAQWTPKTYTLTWSANGGSPTTQNTTGTYGKLASDYLPTIPTKTGYTFSSWSPDPDYEIVPSTTTFTAQWTPKTYTLTWNANGGSPTTQTTTGTYNKYASSYLPTIEPTRTGYNFSSWSPNPNSTTISGATTFNAQWSFVGVSVPIISMHYTTSIISGWTYYTAKFTFKNDYSGTATIYYDYGYGTNSSEANLNYVGVSLGSGASYTITGLSNNSSSQAYAWAAARAYANGIYSNIISGTFTIPGAHRVDDDTTT